MTVETLCGFFWMSEAEQKESIYALVKDKLKYIPQEEQPYYQYYLDYFDQFSEFPTYKAFQQATSVQLTPDYDVDTARRMFMRLLNVYESNYISDLIKTVSFQERSELVSRLQEFKTLECTECTELLRTSFRLLRSFLTSIQSLIKSAIVRSNYE